MKKTTYIVLYFTVLIGLFIFTGMRLRLPHLLVLLLPLAFFEKKPKDFLVQWLPFVSVIFIYDAFRSIADNLGRRVNYDWLPYAERKLFFGVLPTVELQQLLGPQLRGAVGIFFCIFYFGHFILPVVMLYFLWQKNIWEFRRLCFALALVSIMGFITFCLFPAAPPWMASDMKLIPHTDHTILYFLKKMRANLPDLYLYMNPNKVAPFPSLHAAYPLLAYLCGRRQFPKLGFILLLNLLCVSIAIVIFAEHYVVDILGGWLYALLAYSIVGALLKRMQSKSLNY